MARGARGAYRPGLPPDLPCRGVITRAPRRAQLLGVLVAGAALFGLAAGCEGGDDALLVPLMTPPGRVGAPGTSEEPGGAPGVEPSGVEPGGGEAAPPLGAELTPALAPAGGAGGRDAGSVDTGGADAGTDPGAPDAGAGDAGPPPSNDCCTASASGRCRDAAVAACVCEGDPFCCSTEYDATCVTQAVSRCGLDCDERPPASDCCAPSDVPGCTLSDVQACVCDIDPICCVFRFDQNCVNLATSRCGAVCGDGGAP